MVKSQVAELNQTIEDKLTIISESFQAGNTDLLEMSGSFRVDFESGHTVYIYVEIADNSITARFETGEKDPDKRRHEVEMLRSALANEIGFADISEFQVAKSYNDRFVYTAGICIDESVFFHETIVIGEHKTDKDEIFLDQDDEQEDFPDLIEIEEEPKIVQASVEEAIGQLETIDAKMLRQSLDMMNLKRSSNVRMALTRIFRSAGDVEELMLSIQNEAGKIVSHNDREDLRIIKTINADGFLTPVIGLLYEEVFGTNSER